MSLYDNITVQKAAVQTVAVETSICHDIYLAQYQHIHNWYVETNPKK